MSGFAGVGGGFLITPALIVLGFPAHLAVGTSVLWIVGNATVGSLKHRQLGNVDVKLGAVMILAAMGGMEVGVRILNWVTDSGLGDRVVLLVSIFMLFIVGIYTLQECTRRKKQLDAMLLATEEMPLYAMRGTSLSLKIQNLNIPPMLHFAKTQVTISLWIMLTIGFFVGILIGLIGIGGGFIMVPSLIYLVGLSSFMAIGTSLFQILISGAYGTILHTISGNVIFFAAFIMLIASSIGVQFGALVTKYVRGLAIRYILGISIIICAIGTSLKLANILLEKTTIWLQVGSMIFIFGGLGLIVIMIIALFLLALRYRRGQHIPNWVESLVAKTE